MDFKEWTELFDENISKIWHSEIKELQKVGMLFAALEREIQNIQIKVSKDISYLRQQIQEKESLQKETSWLSSPQKEKEIFGSEDNLKTSFECESPDLFKHAKSGPNTSNSDMEQNVMNNLDDKVETSPTINTSKRKQIANFQKLSNKAKMLQGKQKVRKKLLHNELDSDISVIDCSPETDRTKTDFSENKLFLKKKQLKNTNTSRHKSSKGLKRKPTQTVVKIDTVDSDETFYEENCEEPMQLTDLLNYINKTETSTLNNEENILQNSNLANKKSKLVLTRDEKPTTGETDKKCLASLCETCMKLYSKMNLSPQQMQKKVEECSKHRNKLRREEDTMSANNIGRNVRRDNGMNMIYLPIQAKNI